MTKAEDDNSSNGGAKNRGNDPTENVKALSEAANKRQDDLREADRKLTDARHDGAKALADLRAECNHELALAESKRVNEQLAIRAGYEEQLRTAEAKRIDAIRAVDVNAVSVASQRASDQASVLATQVAQSAEQLRTQVAQSAEALRALVATTAATAATTLQQLVTGLSTRLTTLEQAQYEGKGKQSYADPAFAELLTKVDSLRGTKSEGIGASWGIFLGAAGLIAAVVMGVIAFTNRPQTVPSQPQVIYVPSPVIPPQTIPQVPPSITR